MRSGHVKQKAEEYPCRAISLGNKAYKACVCVCVCVHPLISASSDVEARGPKGNYSSTNVMQVGSQIPPDEGDRPLKCLDDGKIAHGSDMLFDIEWKKNVISPSWHSTETNHWYNKDQQETGIF